MKKEKKTIKRIKTGNKITDKLYEAVRDYVESKGGTVAVIGGIALVQENPLQKFNYGVMVRITGKKPIQPPLTIKR